MGGRRPWEKTASALAGQRLLEELRADEEERERRRLARLEVRTRPPDPPLEFRKGWME